MQWIDERKLETWAKRTDARLLLADLVADLISATVDDPSRFRFPGGDSGQVRGWDGDLEVKAGKGFVPSGRSKWEFGTSPGAAKATADYTKRTDQTPHSEMADNTLVLVNLVAWDTPREKLTSWESDRRKEGKWKDVRYIDGVELVHWLDDHPAIAARYARQVLQSAPKRDALSTDEYWDEFSRQFKPHLREEAVIAGRQQAAEELIAKLAGPAGLLVLGSESSEEVLAFVVAAIRLAPDTFRKGLENKTLIVRTEDAARELSLRENLVLILTGTAEKLAGLLADKCTTLTAVTGAQANRAPPLPRPTAMGMAEGFRAMGMDVEEGYELAQRCGRSLTILKRLMPNGNVAPPDWLPHASLLKPMFLAGAWSSRGSADREILKQLGGFKEYEQVDALLSPTLSWADRPLDRAGEIWAVRAPVDAFFFYGRQLTESDLDRLSKAIVEVFSKPVEEPKRDQEFNQAGAAKTEYSNWLRDGLALTLVIIATMHASAELHIAGKSAQQYVDGVVSSLTDWGKTHHSLVRLKDQAALFAEAAPNPFLRALESMLEGGPNALLGVFSEEGGSLFGSSSPHIQLLWALETLAWDPKYLNRAVSVLTRLAQIDPHPHSNHQNRPLNSLRHILLGWAPNTYAGLEQRTACLDAVISTCPSVGWDLVVKLLPQTHDSSVPTRHPKLRDSSRHRPETITFGLVWDFEASVVERAIQLAGHDEQRLQVLISHIGALRPASRTAVLARIDQYLTSYQSDEGSVVWQALMEEASRHEYFGGAEWAVRDEELHAIKDVVERHRPTDPLASDRYAFDDWTPHIGKYLSASDASVDPDEYRGRVIGQVLQRSGIQGVLRLAKMVKLPQLVAPALGTLNISEEELLQLLEGALLPGAPQDLAPQLSALGFEKFGEHWQKPFRERILYRVEDEHARARLLSGWPSNRGTWSFVEELGEEVKDRYWKNVAVLPTRSTIEDLVFAVDHFRREGRDLEVLRILPIRGHELPTELLIQILRGGISKIGKKSDQLGNMRSYYVGKALGELRTRSDASQRDIAGLEYAYLPIMEFDYQPHTFVSLMAEDPELFVDVLSHVFRSKNSPSDEEVTEQMQARASISYKLLMAFKRSPGLREGKVDSSMLRSWVDRARKLASEKGLAEIGDQQIGAVLAHSPPDQQQWPQNGVCEVIEAISSEQLERGFEIECFNKRGVYSKALDEGGNQERALAAKYQTWADSLPRFPRTSAMLANIAASWLLQADHEDLNAEKQRLRS